MDIQQFADNNEGKLIYIKNKFTYYIASTEQGIAKFNLLGDITELGVDHNTTFRLINPIRFEISSSDDLRISLIRTKEVYLKCGTIVIKRFLYTNKGRLRCKMMLNVNSNGELSVSLLVRPRKISLSKEACSIGVSFMLPEDFVEIINSKEQKFAVLKNSSDKYFIVNAVHNINNFVVENTEKGVKCIVYTEKVIKRKYRIASKFKIGMRKEE